MQGMPASLSPLPLVLASAVVGAVEQILLNPLSVLRSKVFAGRPESLGQLTQRNRWACGLRLVLFMQVAQNVVGYGLWAALSRHGMSSWAAGMISGAVNGIAFAPCRRVLFQQHLGAKQPALAIMRRICRLEGIWGLWRGLWISLVRNSLGAMVYFGALGGLMDMAPTTHPALVGAAATAASTIARNPCEVALARIYTGLWKAGKPREYARGLGVALARTVPAKALTWWAIYGLAGALASAGLG